MYSSLRAAAEALLDQRLTRACAPNATSHDMALPPSWLLAALVNTNVTARAPTGRQLSVGLHFIVAIVSRAPRARVRCSAQRNSFHTRHHAQLSVRQAEGYRQQDAELIGQIARDRRHRLSS